MLGRLEERAGEAITSDGALLLGGVEVRVPAASHRRQEGNAYPVQGRHCISGQPWETW